MATCSSIPHKSRLTGRSGTSPLYVLSGIFGSDAPSEEDTIGAISAIIWALTLEPLLKYCLFALAFANETPGGQEGGPFSLFAALYKEDGEPDDIAAVTTYGTRTLTRRSDDKPLRRRVLDLAGVHTVLLGIALFAVALTMSDGLLTPAVSILSSTQGLAVVVPSLDSNAIIGISIAIVVVLFAIQPFGTSRIGFSFAPIVFLWLAILFVSGVINTTKAPQIFRAFDPTRAILWLKRTGDFDLLSGVLLSITGCEAMFANVGQFNKASIRLSFTAVVYPALVFAYLGQGAALIADPENTIVSPFYASIPGGNGGALWWITWLMGVLATVVASQALITAVFSLVSQLIAYKAIPSYKLVRTSESHFGQVYAPAINILLMIGTIALIGGFGTSTGITNAYGFAVSGVLIITTFLLALNMRLVSHWPVVAAIAFFLPFVALDGAFFGAALHKVPDGAYVPLALAGALVIFFGFFTWAKALETMYARMNRIRISSLLAPSAVGEAALEDDDDEEDEHNSAATSDIIVLPQSEGGVALQPTAFSGDLKEKQAGLGHVTIADTGNLRLRLVGGQDKEALARLPVFAVFHRQNATAGLPPSFAAFVRSYPALPKVAVFAHVKMALTPQLRTVEDRIVSVDRVRTIGGVYQATVRFGYREAIDFSLVMDALVDRIAKLEASVQDVNATKRAEEIRSLASHSITHFIPTYAVTGKRAPPASSVFTRGALRFRRALLENVYVPLSTLFSETANYRLEGANVVRLQVPATL